MSTKSLKPTKPPLTPLTQASRSSSLSAHLAIVELKQRILNSLSKLSDRDTHQIAVEDLETIIKTLSPDSISIVLNSLYDATNDTTTNKPAVKKEAIRLLSFLCATHTESAATHLIKIIPHILKRLKDSDSGVKDSCRESIGHLSFLYLKGERDNNSTNIGSVVSLFVKPLFEAMNEQNKGVQSGAAMCMAKMVEMASDPPFLSFQKLCNRICKFLNSPNFLANAALLPVVSSLSQVGAIAPQSLEPLLQSIHDCLSSSDWATRKAAADTLNVLALHSSNLITEKPTSTIAILEASRFDKIKPVRDSITEALQLWKNIAEGCEDKKTSHDENSKPAKWFRKAFSKMVDKRIETPTKAGESKGQNVSEKTTGMKKKAPPLSDKELNPEFFQNLERRVSGEVEVVVPRRHLESLNMEKEEESEVKVNEEEAKSKESCQPEEQANLQYRNLERGGGGLSSRQRESDDKGNLLGIQRQLLQLERQQGYIMNMLQNFKGGSQNGMVTLENRVWGLERVVEDLACNLSVSANPRRGSNHMMGFDESSGRLLGKHNGFSDYPNTKLGRNKDGMSYMGSNTRVSRGSSWDYRRHTHGRNTQIGLRRAMDGRLPKGAVGPVRFGEGPSARSVWQASKDEATLEAIRVAAPEVLADKNLLQNHDPLATAWRNAMDGLHKGDMDLAFDEVLSTGDGLLLVKLMDRTGPVVDQLSSDFSTEVLHAVSQFLLEPNLFDICLSWIQQLLDTIVQNGRNDMGIPDEVKREILVNLNEASSNVETPEEWEGLMPDQLLLQLASIWEINLQQLLK